MHTNTKPDKQAVRDWQQQRLKEHTPPPTPESIRMQLGWKLVQAERKAMEHLGC